MAVGIERRDLGYGRIKKQLGELAGRTITLGIQGEQAAETHPVAKVPKGVLALWLHAGTKHMQARPFVDVAIADLEDDVAKLVRKAVSDLIDGRARSVEDALQPVGEHGSEAVRDAIDRANSWVDWDLSPQTVARKGHNRHLIDTGETRDAVTYAIRDGDRIKRSGK